MALNKAHIIFLAVLLSACAPSIPTVNDPLHPEVDGEEMSSVQFLQRYCMGVDTDPTCSDVRNAVAESLKSLSAQ
jgi:hypothetical protein